MCTGEQRRPPVKQLWNGWLEERDRAPGDLLAEWFREKTRVGLEAALEAAGVALEAAWARAEALRGEGPAGASPAWEALLLGAPCGVPPERGADAANAADGAGGVRAAGGAAPPAAPEPPAGTHDPGLEELVGELFRLQDLNGDGLLQEEELVRLSEQLAALRGGAAAAAGEKCREVFRAKLDPHGRPVRYEAFRQHMLRVLAELDPSEQGRVRMARQFIAEAQAGRAALCYDSIAVGPDARSLLRQAPGAGSPPGQAPSTSSQPGRPAPGPSQAPFQALSFADRVQSASALADASARQDEESSGVQMHRGLAPSTLSPSIAEEGPGGAVGRQARSAQAAGLETPEKRDRDRQNIAQGKDAETRSGNAQEVDRGSGHAAAPWLPKFPADAALEVPGGRTESFDSVGSFVPTPSRTDELTSAPFAKGELLQVWSNGRGVWLDGVVEEVFASACEAEGYSVPAGTLKVRSSAGVKWVMAGQAEGVLRRLPAAPRLAP